MLKQKLKLCKTCNKESMIWKNGQCKACSVKEQKPTRKPKVETKQVIKKEVKKKLETIPKLKKTARYWFQRWIRLRDLGNTCCYGSQAKLEDIRYYDACHYLKFEIYPEAGFDENNVHGGTKGENIRDNTIGYRRELIKRKGEDWVKQLEDKYCLNRESYKWDRQFLNDIINKYKTLCKEIESN